MKRASAIIALFNLWGSFAWAGFDEGYPPKTIAQALDELSPTADDIKGFGDGDNWFDFGSNTGFLATVSCKTAAVSLTPRERQFLEFFFEAQGYPERAAIFSRVIECSEGKVSYRLPIQNVLLEPFRKEVRGAVSLFLMYAGSAVGSSGKLTAVVVVNEFRVPE